MVACAVQLAANICFYPANPFVGADFHAAGDGSEILLLFLMPAEQSLVGLVPLATTSVGQCLLTRPR